MVLASSSLAHLSAQEPQSNQATWLPPVHVAPQRSTTIKLSDQYPGVFDAEPAPAARAMSESPESSNVSGQFQQQARRPAAASLPSQRVPSRPAGSRTAAGNSGSRAEPPRGSGQRSRLRTSGTPTPANRPGRSENRQVGYQQNRQLPDESFPQSDVRPAFVADNTESEVQAGSLPQQSVSRTRPGRNEFTRSSAPAVRDAGLTAEFAELEQPLDSFASAPPAQPRTAGARNQQGGSNEASVLDGGAAPESWQRPMAPGNVPARPATFPANGLPPGNSDELPGEVDSRDWNANATPLNGGMDEPELVPDQVDPDTWQDADDLPRPQKTLSCNELRSKLLTEPLTDIALDVSPPLPERGELPAKPSGDWVDHNGNLLARGQLVALSRGYVIVDTAEGRRKISVARLGDQSLALVAAAWQLPGECAIGSGEYAGRCWTPQLSTWYASNLCHKPLYFEQEQLERYGHSAGPVMGPIRSSAHFFGSLALWPYHTAIHPANECIYALGHYRPGNCAPWLVEPFPFSARGAARQGAFVTGAALLF